MKTIFFITALIFYIDTFGQLVDAANLKRQTFYDSTLNGMRLRDVVSVEKVIGVTENMIDSNDYETEISSQNGEQILTMVFLPGDVINQFSQFKVEYNSKKLQTKYKVGQKGFLTGKGIQLGISESQLFKTLGPPKEKKKDKNYVDYFYKQDNGLYFGHYWFANGRLEKFWFGDEYP